MAFSINPQLAEQRRVELNLDALAEGAQRWRTTPDPVITRRLAYRIREALYIGNMYPERFPILAMAYDRYAIHIIEPGIIEAKLKSNPTVQSSGITPQHGGGAPWGREQATVGPSAADEIIDAWQKHLPSSDAMNFPQTTLTDDELMKLWEWATRRNPRLMILVGAGTITVSLRQAEMDSYAWSPPAPPKQEPKTEFDID